MGSDACASPSTGGQPTSRATSSPLPPLSGVLDHLLMGVLFVDADGRVVHANQKLCRMFGLSSTDAVVGQRFSEACHQAATMFVDPELFHRLSIEATRDREMIAGTEHRLLDGRTFERDYVPIWIDGEYWGAVWQYRDITTAKTLNERLVTSERMASMGQLSASIAHEINNPLTSVILNLEVAAENVCVDPAQADVRRAAAVLEEARRAAGEIAAIVRGLATFAGPDHQGGRASVAEVLGSAVRVAHNELRHRARLVTELEEVPLVRGAPAQLGHVFLNLLINAAQALPVGQRDQNEIAVRVRLEGDTVRVDVRDTGRGIAPEAVPRVFEPFFTTKNVKGTGLGLSICHGIVASLGGRIEVESEIGSGSTFRVWLPVAEDQPRRAPEAAAAPTSGSRILVVDDEATVRGVLERLLGMEHDVTTAGSGAEALRRLEAGERFDLILCDLVMPQVDGVALYEGLLELAPEQAERTAFMTGGALTSLASAFLEARADRRIYKPFSVRQLREFVARTLVSLNENG